MDADIIHVVESHDQYTIVNVHSISHKVSLIAQLNIVGDKAVIVWRQEQSGLACSDGGL